MDLKLQPAIKKTRLMAGLLSLFAVWLLSGCLGAINSQRGSAAGVNLLKAATISDEQIKSLSRQMRAQGDAEARVAPPDSSYVKRLAKITEKLQNVNGVPLNYKVYMTNEMNANATPDGSVRVYSGLMDKMNDDELRFVIGHEIGHVALGHSKKQMQMQYVITAARHAAGALNQYAGAISDSAIGALGEKFFQSQYSQSQESDSDAYSMKFLKENGYNAAAAGSALRKLAVPGASGGILNAMFSTHPDPAKRATKMDEMMRAGN